METRVWWIEDNKVWIKNYSDGVFTKLSEPANVKVWGVLLGEDFKPEDTHSTGIGLLESPKFPEEFHMALVYNVLGSLYAGKPETIQVAQYWDMKYQQAIVDAKKRKNSIQGGSTIIKGAEF